jgi:hypothetical protein
VRDPTLTYIPSVKFSFTTRAIGALCAANLIKLRTHPDYVAPRSHLDAALFVAPTDASRQVVEIQSLKN